MWRSRGARRAWLGGLLVVATLAGAIGTSLAGSGFARHLDSRYLYLAGTLWARGESPYDEPTLHAAWRVHMEIPTRSVFLYPPSVALVALPASLASWSTARYAIDAVGAVSAAGCILLCGLLLTRVGGIRVDSARLWLGLWFASLVSAISGALFVGQLTSLALLGCLGAFFCHARGRPGLAAVFVVLATIKPQVGLLPLLFLLGVGAWWPVLAGGCAAGLASLALIAATSGLGFVDEVRASLASYAAWHANEPDRLVGGVHWLGAVAPGVASKLLIPVGALSLLAVFHWRRPEAPERDLHWLSLPFLWTALFVPLHRYDLFLLALPLALLPQLRPGAIALLGPAALMVARPALPRRIAETAGLGDLPIESLGILWGAIGIAALWMGGRLFAEAPPTQAPH